MFDWFETESTIAEGYTHLFLLTPVQRCDVVVSCGRIVLIIAVFDQLAINPVVPTPAPNLVGCLSLEHGAVFAESTAAHGELLAGINVALVPHDPIIGRH